MKPLLIVTAVLEGATGVGFCLAPPMAFWLLLGASLDTPGALAIARVAPLGDVTQPSTCGLGIRWSRTAGDLLFSVGEPDGWPQAKLFCSARITSIIERQQLGAGFTGRKVQRIGKIDPIPAVV